VLLLGLLLAVPIPRGGILGSVESDEDGFSAVLTVPEPCLQQAGGGFWPSITGMSASLADGDLIRPCFTYYIPLPPGEAPSVEMQILARSTFDPGRTWRPSTVPVLIGNGLDATEEYPDLPVSQGPEGCFEVDTCRLAGSLVARVIFYPFTGRDFTSYVSLARLSLSWERSAGSEVLDSRPLSLVCPEGVLWWPPRHTGSRAESPFWGHPWARIVLSYTGCYAVTCAELSAAGCEIEGSPSASLRMFTGPGTQFQMEIPGEEHQLVETAIQVFDGGDGSFDPPDSIVFLGRSLNRFEPTAIGELMRLSSRYSAHNVYWLTWGGEPGLRMEAQPAAPDGSPQWGSSVPERLYLEQDLIWLPDRETRTGWVWTKLDPSYPSYFGFFTAGQGGAADIEVTMISDSGGTHRNLFFMGDTQIGDTITWSGFGRTILALPDAPLVEGTNLLKIVTLEGGPGSLGIYLDAVAVSWPRLLSQGAGRDVVFMGERPGRYGFTVGGLSGQPRFYDWTDPEAPELLEGLAVSGPSASFSFDVITVSRLFLADDATIRSPDSVVSASPGRILGTLDGGEVAIVAGPGMMEGSLAIEGACEARGLQASTVSLREVYDEFGQGVADPGAIRSFIRWALEEWSPAPRVIVLVGDGSLDPLNHLSPTEDVIPVMLELGSDEGICSDDFYGIVSAGLSLPAVPVSRIPVDTPSDLSSFVAREIAYSSGSADGEWVNRLLVAADDEWGNGSSNNEIEHTLYSEMVADSTVPPSLDRVKLYMIEYPWPVGGREKPDAREDFVQALCEGSGAVVFFGHGSYGQIAHEKLFLSSDIARLTNGMRLPLISFASCDVGRFEMISTDCMAEDLVLRAAGGGAIATIAATRGTYLNSNRDLFSHFFELLYTDSVLPAEALWAAKLLSPLSLSNRYYVYFGDGSLPLRRFEPLAQPLAIDGGLLLRGRENSVSASFPEPVTALLSISESGAWIDYTCLGGQILTYLKYGLPAFRGTFPAEGPLEVSFFMPVQADTGLLARAAANGVSLPGGSTAWNEWVAVADSGGFASDSTGPAIELWIEGHEGETGPSVGPEPVLRARLSDPSGIAAFGGSAGRAILVNVDKAVFDASGYFGYTPGSSTEGQLSFEIPYLFEGPHTAILAVWDGMGNEASDTLDFTVSEASGDLLSEALVYPNPGDGQRCFSFRTDAPGAAEVTIYTVAGRAIWKSSALCDEGYSQILWDGLDLDGDPPGSGPYVFRIAYSAGDGRDDEFVGILAVLRED
jgi:hypothetical protein